MAEVGEHIMKMKINFSFQRTYLSIMFITGIFIIGISLYDATLSNVLQNNLTNLELVKCALSNGMPLLTLFEGTREGTASTPYNYGEDQIGTCHIVGTRFDRAYVSLPRTSVYRNLGSIYLAKGVPAEASEIFTIVVELNPQDVINRFFLGHAYWRMGRLPEAVQEWRLADAAPWFYEWGKYYRDHKDIDKTIVVMRLATEIDPSNARYHELLGDQYSAKRMPQEAILEYASALRLDPSSARAHIGLGCVFMEQSVITGDTQYLSVANDWFRKGLRFARNDTDHFLLYMGLGEIARRQQQYKQADDWFHQALAVVPSEEQPNVLLGWNLLDQQRIAESIIEFQQALQKRPSSWAAYWGLGVAYMQQGEYSKAIQALLQAERLSTPDVPNNIRASVACYLGIGFVRSGQLQAAVIEYEKAMVYLPGIQCDLR